MAKTKDVKQLVAEPKGPEPLPFEACRADLLHLARSVMDHSPIGSRLWDLAVRVADRWEPSRS